MAVDMNPRAARRRIPARSLPFVTAAVVVGLWWLATIVFDIDSFLVPSPADIVDAMVRLPDYLLDESLYTLYTTTVGFVIAAVCGLLVALALTAFRWVEEAILPLLVALNSIPKIAIAPLLVAWFGFDSGPKIILVVLLCFFPVVVSSAAGIASTPTELTELARSLWAGSLHTYLKIRLPWALPQIFVGFKVAIALAVIGSVVADIASPSHGLGSVVVKSTLDTPLAFAAVVLLSLISVGLYYVIVAAERKFLPWASEVTG
mgnify:CR=1 FL=1